MTQFFSNKNLIIIMFLGVLAFFSNIGGYSIYILDESKNATCAMEMKQAGEAFFPTFNGEIRTDKPPLHYYFMSVGYSLFGYTPLGARFFSSIMGLLTLLITYLAAFRFFNARVAFLSSLILLSSLHFSVEFHLAVPDPYLIFFTSVGIFAFTTFLESRNLVYAYLIYVSLAFAVLSKGPVAIALPGLIFLITLILTGQLSWKTLMELRLIQGVLLFLLIVLPVYIQLHFKTEGVWTEGFFFQHNLNRFSSTMEGHGGGLLYIPLVILIGMMPLSLFLPASLVSAWEGRNNTLVLVSLLTVGIYTVFFTISSTKLPNYPMPCYPFVAILIGYYLDRLTTYKNLGFRIVRWVLLFVLIVIPIGVYIGLKADSDFVNFNHLAFWFLIPLIGLLVALTFFRKNIYRSIVLIAGAYYIFNLSAHWVIIPTLDAQNPLKSAEGLLNSSENYFAYKSVNPALPFKIKERVRVLDQAELSMQGWERGDLLIVREKYIQEAMIPTALVQQACYRDIFEKQTWCFYQLRNKYGAVTE